MSTECIQSVGLVVIVCVVIICGTLLAIFGDY